MAPGRKRTQSVVARVVKPSRRHPPGIFADYKQAHRMTDHNQLFAYIVHARRQNIVHSVQAMQDAIGCHGDMEEALQEQINSHLSE